MIDNPDWQIRLTRDGDHWAMFNDDYYGWDISPSRKLLSDMQRDEIIAAMTECIGERQSTNEAP